MDTNLIISIIVAMSDNEVIGQKDKIPWNLKSDLQRFKKLTQNHKVIVGRKTHESIIKSLGHPLDNRQSIIITRQKDFETIGDYRIANSWENALKIVSNEKEVFVIGGAEIYRLAIPYTKFMYVTKVHGQYDGNVFFPQYNTEEWQELSSERHNNDEKDECDYTFMVLKRKNFVNLKNARVEEQLEVMKMIQEEKFCPFCPENYSKSKLKPIIKQGEYWHIRKNRWPYKNTRIHLIIIHNTHIEKISEVTSDAAREFLELVKWAEKEYGILGGGIGMRFGDIHINGATVLHLHAHIITAEITDKNNPNYQKVEFKVG